MQNSFLAIKKHYLLTDFQNFCRSSYDELRSRSDKQTFLLSPKKSLSEVRFYTLPRPPFVQLYVGPIFLLAFVFLAVVLQSENNNRVATISRRNKVRI